MNERRIEKQKEVKIEGLEEARLEFKFKTKGLLLEILYLIKDFFVTEVKIIGNNSMRLKFYNGQEFELKITEKIKEETRLI